jgi:hypothetical protein
MAAAETAANGNITRHIAGELRMATAARQTVSVDPLAAIHLATVKKRRSAIWEIETIGQILGIEVELAITVEASVTIAEASATTVAVLEIIAAELEIIAAEPAVTELAITAGEGIVEEVPGIIEAAADFQMSLTVPVQATAVARTEIVWAEAGAIVSEAVICPKAREATTAVSAADRAAMIAAAHDPAAIAARPAWAARGADIAAGAAECHEAAAVECHAAAVAAEADVGKRERVKI